MTDQQQGAPLAATVDQHAYLLGGIRVQMGQWLIQQPQRRVAQQQARQRQAALLPAGQAQPTFAQRGLQAQRQTPQQRGQTNLPQHAPQLPVRGPGHGQPQVVRHTGSQQLWLLGQITYPGLPGRTLQLGQLPTVDLQASLIGDKAQQQLQQGGFAAAAGALYQHPLARRQIQIQGCQTQPPLPAGRTHLLQLQRRGTLEQQRAAAGMVPDLALQQRQQLLHRPLGLGPGMVVIAQLAQRRVELRRQQQDEQGTLVGHGNLAPGPGQQAEQPQPEINRHQRDRQGSEELQHRCGQESHAQHLHGALAVLLSSPIHRLFSQLQRLQMTQGRQAPKQVEKTPAHAAQGIELALAGGGGSTPQQHHEQGHQWRSQQQQGGGQPAVPGGCHQQHQGYHQHQPGLYLIAGQIAIQRIHLLQRPAGQLAINTQPPTGRPQLRQTVQHAASQSGTGTLAGPVRADFAQILQ